MNIKTLQGLALITLVATLGLSATLEASPSPCPTWDANTSSARQALVTYGTATELIAFDRYYRAQLQQCNGSALSTDAIMELHYDNDRAELSARGRY